MNRVAKIAGLVLVALVLGGCHGYGHYAYKGYHKPYPGYRYHGHRHHGGHYGHRYGHSGHGYRYGHRHRGW